MKSCLLSSLFVFFVLAFAPLITLTIDKNPEISVSEHHVYDMSADSVRVLQTSSGNVLNLGLTEYLIGVVASEMPASFNSEALKAQAVASYTYLEWIMNNSDNPENALSDISDNSNTHQGFMTKNEMEQRWGKKYTNYYKKIKEAVESVSGELLVYENEPISAVFHGLSYGKTNSSENIWGEPLPYLVSVEAPGDKLSADLVSTVTLTKQEFLNAIKNKVDINNIEDKLIVVEDETYDGFVKYVKIGNKSFSATDARNFFSLKSPNFTVEADKKSVVFTVYGKGHGLGMSQYSADFMARQGSDYKEILLHFYPGASLVKK